MFVLFTSIQSINSRQQTPCLVSAYLSAPCTSDNYWGVPEIGADGPYQPPSGTYANVCRCNSVQWNLLSACSMCQGGPAGSWSSWVANCSSSVITVGGYPQPVPAGISVPSWAYYDFTGTGVFNAGIAQQQTGPESSAVASATSTSPATSVASGASTRLVETVTATALPVKNTASGSNTGAIAGGVVGGVLGLGLIALIAFVLVRKGKKAKTDGNVGQYAQGGYNPAVGGQPNSAAPMMGQYQPGVQHPGMPSPGGSEFTKAYDPSDPTTFPTPSHHAPSHYPESMQYSQNPSQYRPGQYNGAPEV
ncbi:hypothetical protein BDV93DRAFT_141356 [Ceratobasidium sp. AG-I]|nr:hypothetical protein BDV93DRAFT_141356 [Ceratobasidium sp. AG-I]